LGKYTVTQEEWEAVIGNNPSSFKPGGFFKEKLIKENITDTSRFPVECVSWYDCQKFLAKINERSGVTKVFGKSGRFVLPHENQWEYACRAGNGNDRAFYWGNELNGTQANSWGQRPFGTTTTGQNLSRTCAVDFTNNGKYEKHPWGLMHMHGNVSQWCDNKDEKSNHYILRGGCWGRDSNSCRSAQRHLVPPEFNPADYGFRVCLSME
jgi:formylglycine-generating enzyme required for sulfatase activity